MIALTGHADTPVAEKADFNFTNFAEDDTSSEMFYLLSLVVVLAILEQRGELGEPGFDAIVGELALLPELLVQVKESFEPRAAELAAAYKDEPYHILTGAGSAWTEAWYYGTCILEEMQWIRTRPVHASDFFHGTLELVERDVSVLLFKSEDEARALGDRVEKFVPTVSDKLQVIDPAQFELPGVSAAGPRADLAGPARDRPRAPLRAPRGPPRPPADDPPLLPPRRLLRRRRRGSLLSA